MHSGIVVVVVVVKTETTKPKLFIQILIVRTQAVVVSETKIITLTAFEIRASSAYKIVITDHRKMK